MIYSLEEVPMLKGLHGSMNNQSHCRARISFCYRGSALGKGDILRRYIDMSGDRWKDLVGFHHGLYKLLSLLFGWL